MPPHARNHMPQHARNHMPPHARNHRMLATICHSMLAAAFPVFIKSCFVLLALPILSIQTHPSKWGLAVGIIGKALVVCRRTLIWSGRLFNI
jgi:hypothetical protein